MRAMRYAVIGAGGIGTLVAVLLARAGSDVVLLARSAAAAAIRKRGGGTIDGPLGRDGELVKLEVTDDPAALRAQVVILCVKAHQLEGAIASCRGALDAAEAIVVMQNGIPWWYFAGLPGPHANRRIAAVDPGGTIGAAIPPAKVVGGVVEAAGLVLEPGVVRTGASARFTLGAPDGTAGPHTAALAAALNAGGVEAIASNEIRTAVWRKLLGNAAPLPMSALTRSVPRDFCADPDVFAFMADVLREIIAVAATYGVKLDVTAEERLEQTRKVGAHPPSMLQDLLAGKKLELAALTGAAIELGELAGVAMPATRRLDAMTRLLATALGI
jgi:2-dehydropantoate 2-reductase